MLPISGVEDDSVLLVRCEGDCDVGLGPDVERLHLDVGRVVQEAQARQIFATLA